VQSLRWRANRVAYKLVYVVYQEFWKPIGYPIKVIELSGELTEQEEHVYKQKFGSNLQQYFYELWRTQPNS
jgi:hypothetical protein